MTDNFKMCLFYIFLSFTIFKFSLWINENRLAPIWPQQLIAAEAEQIPIPGRYQILTIENRLYKIDTSNGRVWENKTEPKGLGDRYWVGWKEIKL